MRRRLLVVWDRQRNNALSMTLWGAVVMACGVIAVVVGVVGAWPETLAAGVIFLGVCGGCWWWVVGRNQLSASLVLPSTRLAFGTGQQAHVAVANQSAQRSAPCVLEVRVGPGVVALRVPALVPGGVHRAEFGIAARKRAVIEVGPMSAERKDPLEIFRSRQSWLDTHTVFIHPRLVSVKLSAVGALLDIEGVVTGDLSSSDVSFHALREYIPGDDRRSIHWRTVARTNRLMVRQFEETHRSHLVVALATARAAYVDDAQAEEAISIASSLVVQALRAQRSVSLVTETGAAPTTAIPHFLDAMSALELMSGPADAAQLSQRALRQAPTASMIVHVTGTETPTEDLRRAGAYLHRHTRSVVMRVGAEHTCRRTLPGAGELIELRDADDLARALVGVR